MIPLAALLTLAALSAQRLPAQTRPNEPFGLGPGQTPLLEMSLGYMYMHANAPPGQCGCFSASGGFASAVLNAPHGFSGVADFSMTHAGNIGQGQSITVADFLFGPRYSIRPASSHFTSYGQALFGFSNEQTSYPASKNLNGFTFSVGGGVSRVLSPRIAWNAVEADWIHSQIVNGQNNLQNNLRVTTGITFRFGDR